MALKDPTDAPGDTASIAAGSPATTTTPEAPKGDILPPTEPSSNSPPAKSTPARTRTETIIIMLALCSSLFLVALDSTIITTAVPTIAADFNSSLGYTWVGSAFMLSNAALVPIWGKVSDIWGRKPVLLIATTIFFLGSLLCAVSQSMAMLIASRAIQGGGGGGILSLVNICISDLFSLRQRSFYFGMVGLVWAVAAASGPLLGGVFTSEISWRWCFYINLPVCGVCIVILFFFLKLHNPRTSMREGLAAVDWMGSMTVIGGTTMILLALEFGGITFPWDSATVLCLIIFGSVMIGLFAVIEWKIAKYPVIPLRIFKATANQAALSIAFFQSFVFQSGAYWLPLYFQGAKAHTSLQSGYYLLPFIVSLAFFSTLAGLFIKKTGQYKLVIIAGMATMTLGFGLFIDLDKNSPLVKIIIYQLIAGIGVGPNFQAPLLALQTNVAPRDIASSTATFSFFRQIAAAISIVVGGAIFNNEMDTHYKSLEPSLGVSLAARFSGHNAATSVTMVRSLPEAQKELVEALYAASLSKMYIMFAVFGFVGTLAALFIQQKTLSRDHVEHKTGLKSMQAEHNRNSNSDEEAAPQSEKAQVSA
ncbi:putative transporter C3H1.06c [Ceratocystis platani]|uniref:Efflux pump dotC n=1 Tax=Ceratocystis fimbriata f. sp. platani TaxID=88771 RepID=A0A0F8CNL3_CERFI|nr:putative transporter C3H1.06c [Ceratocystis platani]